MKQASYDLLDYSIERVHYMQTWRWYSVASFLPNGEWQKFHNAGLVSWFTGQLCVPIQIYLQLGMWTTAWYIFMFVKTSTAYLTRNWWDLQYTQWNKPLLGCHSSLSHQYEKIHQNPKFDYHWHLNSPWNIGVISHKFLLVHQVLQQPQMSVCW